MSSANNTAHTSFSRKRLLDVILRRIGVTALARRTQRLANQVTGLQYRDATLSCTNFNATHVKAPLKHGNTIF